MNQDGGRGVDVYRKLAEKLQSAMGDRPKKELAVACHVDASDISHAFAGRRTLSVKALRLAAQFLNLDFSQLMLLKTADELRYEGESDAANNLSALAEQLALRPEAPLHVPETFLSCWRSTLRIDTVLAADRREERPVSYADCLALSGSVADLFYLPSVALPARVRIRSDKIVKVASRENLADMLCHDVLVTGSPSANYATRILSSSTLFPFLIDQETFDVERELEVMLSGPTQFDMGGLAAFMHHDTNVRNLNNMLNAFAKPGFIDPIEFIQARGSAPRGSMDFGIITLAKNRWSTEGGLALVAAGVRGPATAAALKLLTKDGAFDKRPFGGVFKVSISNVAPWERRYDLLVPEWDTHEYSISDYEEAIRQPKVIERLPNRKNDEQLEVIEIVKRRCAK